MYICICCNDATTKTYIMDKFDKDLKEFNENLIAIVQDDIEMMQRHLARLKRFNRHYEQGGTPPENALNYQWIIKNIVSDTNPLGRYYSSELDSFNSIFQ